MRSDCRAEYPRILKDEKELRLNSWIQKKSKHSEEVEHFKKTSSAPLENPERVRRENRGRGRRAESGGELKETGGAGD